MQHTTSFSFLGSAPRWYKALIVAFLIINPLVFFFIDPFVAGWLLLMEFIVTLALALKCYPLPTGGLLALEAVAIGMSSPDTVYHEIAANLPTILLLIFMVAGIYYLKDVILFVFTKVFLSIQSKALLSFLFCLFSATLSSFLDALTLITVIIIVCFNFYAIYSRVRENMTLLTTEEEETFLAFIRNLVMHGAVGTALGGTLTLVGEPQNVMIGSKLGWSFIDFFIKCSVVSVPVLVIGLLLCPLLEKTKRFGFGHELPEKIREAIAKGYQYEKRVLDRPLILLYASQCLVAILLVIALAFHFAEVGLVGIAIIILMSTFTGQTKEHDFGAAFNNAMPFVSLMVVFFAILAVVHDQKLLDPIIKFVFQFGGREQLLILYFVNGTLSLVSDSVFIASVFITEMEKAYMAGAFDQSWYDKIGVIVNMGTNIPAIATPNGQAAFLFLLISPLSPVIKLSYIEMVKLAFPYTVVMTLVGAVAVYFFL